MPTVDDEPMSEAQLIEQCLADHYTDKTFPLDQYAGSEVDVRHLYRAAFLDGYREGVHQEKRAQQSVPLPDLAEPFSLIRYGPSTDGEHAPQSNVESPRGE